MRRKSGIEILAPSGQSARRELHLRAALAAGSKSGDSKYWLPTPHSADSAFLASSPERILARSRDIADNDPLIHTINVRVVNHVIHTGVFPKFNFDHLPEKEDNDTLNKAWKQDFDLWAEYFCHKQKLWPLGIMQRRIYNTQRIDGSLFVGFDIDKDSPAVVCPLRLSIYEIDHLDRSITGPQKDGTLAINGLVFDKDGVFVRAHLFPANPHDNNYYTAQKSVAVPADDLIYTFFSRRAGQRLGRPVTVPIMSLARDLDEYQGLVMKKVKHETSDGGWLEGGTGEDLEGMSGGSQPAEVVLEEGDDWPVRWNDDGTVSGTTEIVQAGLVVRTLPSGAKIVRPQTSAPIAQHDKFTSQNAKRIAVAAGAGDLLGTGNYDGISFSGAGHQKIDQGRDFECEQYEIDKLLVRHIFSRYIHYSVLYGTAPKPELPDYMRLPQRYWIKVTSRFAREKSLNRVQEVKASKDAVEAGFSSEEEEAAANGSDYYENIEAQKRAARKKRELLEEQLENAKILAEIKALESGKTADEQA